VLKVPTDTGDYTEGEVDMESAQGEHECHQGDAPVSLEISTNVAVTDGAHNLSHTERSISQSIQRPILRQADISMLAPAHKQPQAVLPLLK
jgi:hypothetical protein